MGGQITKHHLEFLDEARHVFQKNILRETHINEAGNLIALRYGRDRDCIKIFELGDEVAFFAQMIYPTGGNMLLEAMKQRFEPATRESSLTMNIYAKKGDKVVFMNCNGHKHEPIEAKKHGLVEGRTYTVERTEVGGFHTDVFLQEIPGRGFNSVMFRDAGGWGADDES